MRKTKSRGAVTLRLMAAMAVLWGAAMCWTTDRLARSYADIAMLDGVGFAETVGRYQWLDDIYTEGSAYLQNRDGQTAAWEDYDMLRALAGVNNPKAPEEFGPHMGKYYGEEVAAVFCDRNGNILYECGDYMVFPIYAEKDWEQSWDAARVIGTGMIDLTPGTGNEEIAAYVQDTQSGRNYFAYLRITGYIDGVRVTPAKLEYVTASQLERINESDAFTQAELPWVTLFDKTAGADPEGLTTFYADCPIISLYNEGRTLMTGSFDTYAAKDRNKLRDLLRETAKEAVTKWPVYNQIFADRRSEVIVYDARYYALDGSGDKSYNPDADFILITVSAYRPMGMAVETLLPVYLCTLLLGIILMLILSRSINRNLIRPLRRVNTLIAEGWPATEFDNREPWEEAAQLQRNYHKTVSLRQKDQNEIARLEAALSYAREAEDNRRQMVSAIAHELKTPLAVVHSYAEGLQEKIAEEKRERYLQTILTETERMDAMVMEMLDFSRLEAGKVKLARDRFDLAVMVRDAFEKLRPMAEEKRLKIRLELMANCMVSADEGRICQAVMNLASNAVHYTPAQGKVAVTLGREGRQTVLRVANDCVPFTEEELEKVWETFYRREKARDRKGTELGLPITRQIIQLHGGSCYGKNTETGVEFGIKLPN